MQNMSPVLWQFCHRAHRVPQPGQTAEVHAPDSRLSFGNDQFYFYCRAREPPSHLKLQKRLGLNKAVIFLQGCFSLAVRKPFRHWLFLSGTANELQLQRENLRSCGVSSEMGCTFAPTFCRGLCHQLAPVLLIS